MTQLEQLEKLKIMLGIESTDILKDDQLNLMLEVSSDIALQTLYPYSDTSTVTLPSKYDLWVVRASKEAYQHLGQEGVKSYSENGLSITYEDVTNGISKGLMSQLIPSVGIPK